MIGTEDITAAIRAVVAEVGEDFSYRPVIPGQCSYAPDDANPYGCLIAATIRRVSPGAQFNEGGGVELQPWAKDVSGGTREALQAAQEAQDAGDDWGTALDAYLSKLRTDVEYLASLPMGSFR